MRQPASHVMPEGTLDSRHTMESSSMVLEIETNGPFADQGGTSAVASRRQMAYRSGKRVSVKSALRVIAINPLFGLRRSVVRQHVQQALGIVLLNHEPAIDRMHETLCHRVIEEGHQRIVIAIHV